MIAVPLHNKTGQWLATVRIASPAGVILFQGRVFLLHGTREYHEASNTRVLEIIDRRQPQPQD